MANETDQKVSFKISAADGSDSSNQNYDEEDEGWFASFARRFISKFTRRRSSSVENNNDSRIRQMPGKRRMNIFDLYSLKKNGMSFFSDKVLKYNSRVFKSMLGSLNTIICDVDAICESCCDASKVFKEPVFGRKMVNLPIIGNHLPCMFTNDFLHAKRKAFLMGLSDRVAMSYLLPALVELVPRHMKEWNASDLCKKSISFEDKIFKLMAAIYSKAFLGIVVDHECMKIWHKSIFDASRDRQLAMEAYNSMYKAIKECPMLEEIRKIGVKYKLTEKEMINEVLFVLLFNAIPSTSNAMTSAIGRLANQDLETRQVCKNEAATVMQNGVEMSSINKLNNLENFILEVIRLSPPAPFVFGTARQYLFVKTGTKFSKSFIRSTFVLYSSSGNFTINEGHVLAGNLYEAHRDPEWFPDPKQFNPSRFTDDCMLRDCILSFGGRYTDDAKSGNRKCPGQDIAMIVLKTCLSFFLQCDFSVETSAIFEDKNLERFGLPDEPLSLETFKFHQASWWKLPEQAHDGIVTCQRDISNSYVSFCTEGEITLGSSITIHCCGASSVADDQGSCVEHISPQNLLHPGYQGSQGSMLSYHSEGTNSNSSLSMVDVDMM